MSHARVRTVYFNLNYDGPNFTVFEDIDTRDRFTNKSDYIPPSFDFDLFAYSTSEEFDLDFQIIGSKNYNGSFSEEVAIIH
jgi:hypothetical protein